jgi:hypothetical protein
VQQPFGAARRLGDKRDARRYAKEQTRSNNVKAARPWHRLKANYSGPHSSDTAAVTAPATATTPEVRPGMLAWILNDVAARSMWNPEPGTPNLEPGTSNLAWITSCRIMGQR